MAPGSALTAALTHLVGIDFWGAAIAYGSAFGQGVLVDFTPCVYPLIPITVALFGGKGVSRARALMLASIYVFGMSMLYTVLGVVIVLTSSQFGAWLGNPWVVVPLALLMTMLAASMFGAFDLQLPTSMQTRLNKVGGAGPVGAFLMGLVSGLIFAPCSGPVLVGQLAYIAKTVAAGEGELFAISVLWVFSLGQGTLFFAIALGAGMFRPGPWMEYVKSFFGVALLVMAFWFLRPLSKALADFVIDPAWGLWAGLGLFTIGVSIGAIHLSFHGGFAERARKTLAVGIAGFGGVLALNNFLYVPPLPWTYVTSVADLEQAAERAEQADKPMLIDFSAEWCAPCKELEKLTFAHEQVDPLMRERFELVKIDLTDPNDEQLVLQAALRSQTLPSVVIYAPEIGLSEHVGQLEGGGEIPDPSVHFTKFVEAEPFLAEVRPLLSK